MRTSILNLPATYSTQQDAVTQLFIVRCGNVVLGYADSLEDAHWSARLYASIYDGCAIH